jgi:hypothetical protein
MNNLQIHQANYPIDKATINYMRVKVFQEEQGISEELEFDGLEATAIHLLAYLSLLLNN